MRSIFLDDVHHFKVIKNCKTQAEIKADTAHDLKNQFLNQTDGR